MNIATISTGFEKGDFLVRHEHENFAYFDFFEEAFNYISSKGYARMNFDNEKHWIDLLTKIHSHKDGLTTKTGVLVMVLFRPLVKTHHQTPIAQVKTTIQKPKSQTIAKKGVVVKPSTLAGAPVGILVPPGLCQFQDEWTPAKLRSCTPISDTSAVFRFELPDPTKPLNLSTCACILAKASINEEDVIRPYTPISTNADIGYFDLLIKSYGAQAKMSRHIHELQVGEHILFQHIPFNVKIQFPFHFDTIVMLVGGTGITPMIQALHAILGFRFKKPKVIMLYGSKTQKDILARDLLHQWADSYRDIFQLVNVLSAEPKDSDWSGERGRVDQTLIQQYYTPKTDSSEDESIMFFVCGPPAMYDSLCGPRTDKQVSGVLARLGYTSEQVFKF